VDNISDSDDRTTTKYIYICTLSFNRDKIYQVIQAQKKNCNNNNK